MELKEKLFNAIFDNAYIFKEENIVPECEIISENHAINFAKWCLRNIKKSTEWQKVCF